MQEAGCFGICKHVKKRGEKLAEEKGKNRCRYFQIVITGKYAKAYWLIVETSENTTLKELDQFIRDIWVECCGHLSAFAINGERYECHSDMSDFLGMSSRNMNYRLRDVVDVGDSISYEYDFGSTTELTVSIHSCREEDGNEEDGEYYEPEFLLQICNSPRMGVCGYEGSDVYPELFEPDKE